MGRSQGPSLAATILQSGLSSVRKEPEELITRGQNWMNGDSTLLAGFSVQHHCGARPHRVAR